MSSQDKTPKHIKLDEREHVETPLLDQLARLGWEVIDLTDMMQTPADTHRASFTEVVMTPVLRERLKAINPWIEDDQVEEVVKRLTASFPSTGLLENNKHLFEFLLENTSVSENRQSGEKSPTVRFADFATRDNNRFIAVCQFRVRVLGTEHHIIPDVVLFLNGLPVVVIECKIAQGQGCDSRGDRSAPPLQRAARGHGGRECAAFLLQPVRRGDLPAGSQVRHHHHAHGEVLLPLGRPVSANRGRAGPRFRQPKRPAASCRRHARPGQSARPDSDVHAVLDQ